MQRFLILVFGVLALLFGVNSVSEQQEPPPTDFQLAATEPANGASLNRGDEIRLSFTKPIACETVDTSIRITPEIDGQFSCLDRLIIFTPNADYPPQTVYTLQIQPTLQAHTGERLGTRSTMRFYSAGFLLVSQTVPADGTAEIRADTAITIVFNRPVVPLVTSVNDDNLPHPLSITPEVEGEGEWLNTFVYIFTPNQPLEPATKYTVTFDDDLKATDGTQMPQTFITSFTTAYPRLTGVRLDEQTMYRRRPVINLYFNTVVDHEGVEDGFSLRPAMDAYLTGSALRDVAQLAALETGEAITGSLEWYEDGMTAFFTPGEDLQSETTYIAMLETDAVANTIEETLWSFSTLPYPELLGISPADGEYTENYHGFTLQFNTYMDADTINERLTIEPEPERFVGYRSGMSYQASFPANPRTAYTIHIDTGIQDVFGNVFDEAIDFRYRTRPYPATIHLHVPGAVGFYNAYQSQTTLFLRHLNANRIDADLYRLDPERFVQLLLSQRNELNLYNYVFQAADLMRSWQVEISGPHDTNTPTLLSLGSNSSCQQVGENLFKLGDVVAIQSDEPVEAFTLPTERVSQMLLHQGLELPLVGGPVCGNDETWWQVEIGQSRVWIEATRAQLAYVGSTEETAIDVSAIAGSDGLSPGIYSLNVELVDPVPRNPVNRRHTLLVMTANLTMKTTVDQLTIWATDVQSGSPIVHQPVRIYDLMGLVAAGVTDENGLLKLPLPPVQDMVYSQRVAIMESDTHFGVGMSGWADGIDPGMFGVPANFRPTSYSAVVYTDRQAYRPGETVYYRGIVRSKYDMTYTPPEEFRTVTVSTCNGQECIETEVPLTGFGTFSGSFVIAEDSSLSGYNSVQAFKKVGDTTLFSTSANYSVAEFRLPEYQVQMTPAQDDYAEGDTIQIAVSGEYYSGGPVGNAEVSYRIIAMPFRFRYVGEGHYRFDSYAPDRDFWSSREVGEGEVVADSSGTALVEIAAELADRPESQRFTIEATLKDESNQVVSSRTDVNVHAGQYYIGTRPERYVTRVDESAQINLILVDWDSVGVEQHEVEVEVYHRSWNSVQRRDPVSGYTYWEYETEDTLIRDDTLTTDLDGRAIYAFTPVRGGVHLAIFKTRDPQGNEITRHEQVWVTSRDYVAWQVNNNNRIALVADRDQYQVGDTAEILITSPFQGVSQALITVERYGLIQAEVVTMDTNSFIYRLPIEPDYAPNVFVSIMVVSGVNEFNPVSEFRMGLLQISVDIEQKRLNVEIESDQDQVQPQDTVKYTIHTTNYAGEPVQAEVGVALTDVAALAIGTPPSLDADWLLNRFYLEQGLSVRTSTPLTINADRVTRNILDEIKGGGGGGGEGLPTNFDIRQEFISTPYWNADVVTDENGEATFEVTLPDNLTTWTLNAHAVTRGDDGLTLVGQAATSILSTRSVLIRPVTPRFAVVGDEMIFAAVVNNNSGQTITADVWLEIEGVTLNSEARQQVEIPANERQRVEWPVTIENVPHIEAVFYVASLDGVYTDASRPSLGRGTDRLLPVYRYEAPETVGTSGMLRDETDRLEIIDMPDDFEIFDGNVTVKLQSSLAATTIDSLDYLETYPYYCVEQTVSRFLPNIITYRALKENGLADDVLERNLSNNIQIALQKLYAEQKADGGWGWFLYEPSHPTTTSYALIGLVEARRQGFVIDPQIISKAQGFLRSRLTVPGIHTATWVLNQQAFILYALARSGDPDIAATANLFEMRSRLNLDARAYLALTLHMIDPQSTLRTEPLLADFNTAAIMSATGTHWEERYYDRWNWSTDTRTTALALEVLVKLEPQSELIPNVVRWLISQRTTTHWVTTQETAWAVMALSSWMQTSGDLEPDYNYAVVFNGDTQLQESASAATIRDTQELVITVQDMLQSEANTLLFSRTEGSGGLYYTAHLTLNLPVPEITALDRGIIIQRRYTRPDDENQTPITEVHVGENVQVHLTIIAPQDLHYINIQDPIPAGAEAIDPRLPISQQIGVQPTFNRVDLRRGWGWWWFTNREFRDEKVVLSARYLPAGIYEFVYTIRATLPGTYNVIPATSQEFYFPEVYGRSDGMEFIILP